MIRIAFLAAMALALVACSATSSRDAVAMDAPATASDAKAPPPRPAKDLPPRSVLAAMPDYAGIGPLRFGMTAEQMRKSWGLPLYGEAPADDPQACYYLRPQEGNHDLLFMVEGGQFVRVDVRTADKVAPGGGRVGMELREIEKLHAGHMTATPGKYDPAAKMLSVASPRGGSAKLVFETNASGAVTAWRIGVAPQVDYVEGCG